MSTMTMTAPNEMKHEMLGTAGGKDSGIIVIKTKYTFFHHTDLMIC